MNELYEKAKAEIANILYITIATVSSDGNPWNTPVYSAFDEDYNFYWISDKENTHSQNIQANGKAFLVIYNSTVPAGTGLGVYLEGIPTMLDSGNEDECKKASSLLARRQNEEPGDIKEYLGEYPRRIFKFTPTRIYVNVDGEKDGNFVDKRVEITKEFFENRNK